MDGLKAGAPVVIGAFPEADLELVAEQAPVAGDAPEPFAVPFIDEALFYETPGVQCGGKEALLSRQLVGVQEADDGLRLGPPFLVCIREPRGPTLVVDAAVGVDALGKGDLGNL